ncbi:hypothetical protein D3C87_236490 [compost metagenome]
MCHGEFDYSLEWDNFYTSFQVGKWVFDFWEISLSIEDLFMTFCMTDPVFMKELPVIASKHKFPMATNVPWIVFLQIYYSYMYRMLSLAYDGGKNPMESNYPGLFRFVS